MIPKFRDDNGRFCGSQGKGKKAPNWQGGIISDGTYLYVYSPYHPNAMKNGYVAQHRIVMEQMIGRYLKANEVVHHRDGNPKNNLRDNLQLFTESEHNRFHRMNGNIDKWARDWNCCRGCMTTERKHASQGLCANCYSKERYNAKH